MSQKDTKGGQVVAPKFSRKADTKAYVGTGTLSLPEDDFHGSYEITGSMAALQPELHPALLKALTTQNNTLLQCVEAMEVNIEATGHKIVKREGDEYSENPAEEKLLTSFFSDPYPGKTMTAIRRALRRDLESVGYGCLEVIRDASGEVALLDRVPAASVRLLRLDEPVLVKKTVLRNGEDREINMTVRERRFVRSVGSAKVYYAEFGASRQLDAKTGKWIPKNAKLSQDQVVASQIIFFKIGEDLKSAYGTPRWINQIPSVLGSRKAEELNLDYFDAGGIPPALIFVQGGTLTQGVTDQLNTLFSGGPATTSRVAVVEAVSTSGGLDSSGSVNVRVERFGSERASDGMFSNYDAEGRAKVRRAFRLPPIFLGESADYNFATAKTAYMVAEAQVFLPERDEFDNVINSTIVKALGVKNYVFKSLPLTLVDVENQLKAIEMTQGTLVSGETTVQLLNELTGLNMTYEKQEQPNPLQINPLTGLPVTTPSKPDDVDGQPGSTESELGVDPDKDQTQLAPAKDKAKKLAADFSRALYADNALSEDLLNEVGALSAADKLTFASTLTEISGMGDNFADILFVAHQLTHKADCGCGVDHAE